MVNPILFIVLVPVIINSYFGIKLWMHVYKTYHRSFTGIFVTRWELTLSIFKNMHPQDKKYVELRKNFRIWLLITIATLGLAYLLSSIVS